MKKLKPCPFCGEEVAFVGTGAELEYLTEEETKEMTEKFGRCLSYYAVCCDCNEGGCGATSGYHKTEEEAITAWNNRECDKKDFTIAIEETASQEFKIKAESIEEAIEIAKKQYNDGKLVLEDANLVEKNITCLDEPMEWETF